MVSREYWSNQVGNTLYRQVKIKHIKIIQWRSEILKNGLVQGSSWARAKLLLITAGFGGYPVQMAYSYDMGYKKPFDQWQNTDFRFVNDQITARYPKIVADKTATRPGTGRRRIAAT
jgi:hypothetical protein